jgi:hypothetical protein
MSDEQTPQLFPAWRHAENRLLLEGLEPGKIIPREWFMEAFGLREAQTVPEVQRNALIFLRQLTDLRDSLLQKHSVMLRVLPGIGYQVVPPEHQTAVAMKDRTDEIKRSFAKLSREISHVQLDALNDAQRAENANAIAKLGTLRALMAPMLKPPEGEDDV